MRYKNILESKLSQERIEKDKQESIRKNNGIEDSEIYVMKRTRHQLLKLVLGHILGLCRLILAAIGILIVMEPSLRNALFAALKSFGN